MQRNNHPSKPIRQTFSKWWNSATTNLRCKTFIDAYRCDMKRFFANNEYLCHLKGMSENAYLKHVAEETGFVISHSFYYQLKNGSRVTAKDYVFIMLAACHGYTMFEMMLQDLTKPCAGSRVA